MKETIEVKPIPLLENATHEYLISIKGIVYIRNKTTEEISIKRVINKGGYERIRVSVNGVKKEFGIHRLVAMVFLDDYSEELFVNHINGVKDDNRLENLEMTTVKENARHYITQLKEDYSRVLIICKIRKEVIEIIDFTSDAVDKYGIWVLESLRGNSTKGNLIAVKEDEYNEADGYEELLKLRVRKNSFKGRVRNRKYSEEFVYELQTRYKNWEGLFKDFCKIEGICPKIIKRMLEDRYFKPNRHQQNKSGISKCFYSGVSRISGNYNKKLKIPKKSIIYKKIM